MVRFNVHKTLAICMIKWKIFKLFYLPVYKGSLGKHQIKLFIQTRPSFLNGSCIDETCYSAVNFSQVPSRDNGWWLVINSNLIWERKVTYCKSYYAIIDGKNDWVVHLKVSVGRYQMAFDMESFKKSNLKSGRTPINKLNCFLWFDLCNCHVDIFWCHIASV